MPITSSWNATNQLPAHALRVGRSLDADDPSAQPVTLLRHHRHPFTAALTLPQGANPALWLPDAASLRAVARAYVDAIASAAGMLDDVAAALGTRQQTGPGGLQWLPLAWGHQSGGTVTADAPDGTAADPRAAFWVLRRDAQGRLLDRTAVLLAGRCAAGDPPGSAIGGDVGLRVVAHVGAPRQSKDGGWVAEVRITGATLSRLHDTRALQPVAAPAATLAQALDLRGGVVLQSLRTGDAGSRTLVQGEGWRTAAPAAGDTATAFPDGRPGRVSFSALVDAQGAPQQLQTLASRFANATGWPAPTKLESWAAARRAARLNGPAQPPPGPAQAAAPGKAAAQAASAAAAASATAAAAAPTPPAGPIAFWRSGGVAPVPGSLDEANEVLARSRLGILFDRLAAYGLGVDTTFKLARLPLGIRNRAPIGGDEEAVNAEVRPVDAALPCDGPWHSDGIDARPRLLVRFGAADVATRWSYTAADGRLRDVQTLSIAVDPAWAWHEIAHVLQFASTGQLELRFAHSIGDALAAIDQDPGPGAAGEPRGQTFRVVPLPRRHDREARLGWCWCGRRSQVRLASLGSNHGGPLRRLGYFEEELLSSALFRLYRSLGGDTPSANTADPGWAVRRSAAEYTLYLAMRAVALLGPDALVPAVDADHLVSALIDADAGTDAWSVVVDGGAGQTVTRQGGQVHKVVRWAFEAQGLYATDDPAATVEGPGQPPPVDLFIADRRPAADGGYAPVPLLPAAPDAAWLAAPRALRRQSNGIAVTVRNRGRAPATQPGVRAWAWSAQDNGWVALRATSAPAAPVLHDQAGEAGFAWPDGWDARAPCWVLAAADDPADPSNLDTAPTLPAPGSVALMDLVAHDNNLALARL